MDRVPSLDSSAAGGYVLVVDSCRRPALRVERSVQRETSFLSERPVLYQVDARVWLREESRAERRPVTLDSIPASSLDRIADLGFRWVWLVGIWSAGRVGPDIRRRWASALEEYRAVLPDLELEDIAGSPLAVAAYRVPIEMGGDEALETLRAEMARRDLRILVDFVADGIAPDHPWALEGTRILVRDGSAAPGSAGGVPGTQRDLLPDPRLPDGTFVALARDELGLRRPDALQLDYRSLEVRSRAIAEMEGLLSMVDGLCVRRVSGSLSRRIGAMEGAGSLPPDGASPRDEPFWPEALRRLRARAPHALILAEVDADSREEPELSGFDGLLEVGGEDLLLAGDASRVRDRLGAEGAARMVRAIERLGGRRAAAAFPAHLHASAVLLNGLCPGIPLVVDGQVEGRKIPQHPDLSRRSGEPADREIRSLHASVLELLARPEVSRGHAVFLSPRAAWVASETWRQFVVLLHAGEGGERLLTAVNHGPARGQCYLDLPMLEPAGHEWVFQDLLSVDAYVRDGNELAARGLYLELPAWDYNVFAITRGRAL